MNLKSTNIRLESRAQATAFVTDSADRKSAFLEYFELTKPRLSLLSVITAIVGYIAALPQRDFSVLIGLVMGTSLAAGGAAVLNMWMEREADARMARTRHRPLPSGAVSPQGALAFGLAISLAGSAILFFAVNALAAILALATQLSYVLAYTPLKKRTPLCTEVGAIPGALPPLIGWAGAEGGISTLGWILFAILLFWQIPHFMALAWTYRNDYAQAGFPMGSVVDPSGKRISRESFVCTVLLLAVSVLPTLFGFTSFFYAAVALVLGLWFLRCAAGFLRADRRSAAAKKLFFASIAYLPILLAALVVDRLFLI